MSMSTDITQPNVRDMLSTDFEWSASFGFIAFAILLITVIFVCPFADAWNAPLTYAESSDFEHVDVGATGGSFARQVALGSLGLFGIVALFTDGGRRLRLAGFLGLLCAVYLIWCAASCVWADDLPMSFRRWVAFMCEVFAAIAIAKRVMLLQFVWIVFGCTLAWLGIGFWSEVSRGLFRPWESGYRFAGVFHPNSTGIVAAVLVLASMYLATAADRGRWLLIAAALAGLSLLLLTRSRTALATMIVAFAVLRTFTAPASRKLLYIGLAAAISTIVIVGINSGAFVVSEDAAALGRDDAELSTLSSRVPLWQELLGDYAPNRPLLGYGYGAFWSPQHIADLERSQGWVIPSAHSTYIDLVLNLGFIGAAICVLVMFLGNLAALRRENSEPHQGYGFISMLMTLALVGGITESYVGDTWFLSLFGICGVCYLVFNDHLPARQTTQVAASVPLSSDGSTSEKGD
jgi:O-antigen ligase